MGNEKVHRETIIDQPSMTSVVTKEYLVLPFSDVVIHKQFFEFWTVFVFLGTCALLAIGLWTDWYWQLALGVWALVKIYWYVPAGLLGITSLCVYLNYKLNHRKKSVPLVIQQ
jgi:hypothetical protein